ncbi:MULTISPECIES: bifunctional glycosyltransferase/CDP-glycerol:glycerophosphate glycerophosphotransferase [Streptomyces]|uniref:Bifunctional glycosyltransferase family 2 protein/CDP-glycerol:glycerophosphate glycerophosphotransferase n=1 Tax=Streptomyces flaveolus TaxID=67297 RepID=A0ABV3A609_9ACTN|nr:MULTISPECIES: bifunctional glycosyltransferase family 2 protein/CDP-glycerol:glycerophosphate glycerophosphotransferase [Streptomyces]KMS90928.1 glycosyl transferase [Streptomyces regensis]KOG66475.1 glycosyl transferase [Streptomyces antibioticus]
MPRFSVIVPAYKVQAYLSACLDSVLSQSYPDLELIAVDDCSPDACGAIIDEYAARDARVKPVHLAENQGLGRARNAGLAEATGDYLVFLDSDDTLTPDALRAIADRLKETGDPDVLVFDYARTYWDGSQVRNQLAAQLTEQGPAPFRLEDRPGLLRVLMVAWNKAYRREFVARHGFTFPPGYYEDTPWTFPVLLTAESLATLDRVCVHYRQRRRGSILGTTSRRHFDLFEQYDRVFAYVEERPELARWRPELFRRMVDHFAVVFTRRGRLPRGSHGEFLRRARAHYRRHRVPGARPRLRHGLIRFGLHRTFRALRLAAAVRRRVLRTALKLARALRTGALRLHYGIQLRLPLRSDRAVFASPEGYGDPAALEEAFRAHAPRLRTAWVATPGRAVPPGPRRLTPGTAAYWTALARSRYLVSDARFERRLRKRPGQVVVRVLEGTPLGHAGLDLLERPAAARDLDFAELLRDVDQWDYVLSGNRHATLTWERVLPGGYTTLEYGLPRNDVLQRATAADVARLRASLGVPEGAVAVLYAPAHRDHRRTQVPLLDLERILRRLGPRFVILARTPVPVEGTRIVDVCGHPDLAELCLASDALLTDYAPVLFDYAGLDRPIVVHTEDWAAYEACRGAYFDLREFPPGAVARSEDELIDIFASGHWRGSRSAQLRAAFRERFCPWDDGHAAERVVRRVVLGETEPPAAVPLADRVPAPSSCARAPLATVPQPSGPLPVTESR